MMKVIIILHKIENLVLINKAMLNIFVFLLS